MVRGAEQGQVTSDTDVRLAEVIATLSLATDLGMGQPPQYALRSCLLAIRLGGALGLDEDDLNDVYYLALLRFAGCTADAPLAAAAFGGDEVAARTWFATVDYGHPTQVVAALVRHIGEGLPPLRRARTLAGAFAGLPKLMDSGAAHCDVAQQLAARLGLGTRLQPAMRQLYARWDGRGQPAGLKGETIAVPMRVVQLAQDGETFFQLGGVEAAVAMVRRRSGGAYDPWIVDCFRQHASKLLARTETESIWRLVLDAEPGPRPHLSGDAFDTALRAMADFIDLKTPYTGNHSSGVATLAAAAATWGKLPARDVVAVRRAGLLHDIGRVGIAAGLWIKPGPFSEEEWERVRLHPYYTERVLGRSEVFKPLGALAALPHERLDGSGYHRGLPAALLPPTARILAAADVYHAMTEPRPHRPALAPDRAAEELRGEVRAGRLDGDAATAVLAAAGHRTPAVRRDRLAGLTDREVDVLRLLARGLSNRRMAAQLTVSQKTVDNHVQHIYEKIAVSTRAGATLFALQHDLLSAVH
jgi:HD-GYP domain-containing protein (c-di-GMP phosphodiesterase class II)